MKIVVTPKSLADKESEIRNLMGIDAQYIMNTTGKTFSMVQMAELCSDADGVVVGVDPMPKEVLDRAKKLVAISKYGSGLDNIDVKAAEGMGIRIARVNGGNSRSVAELAIGLMLEMTRSLYPAINSVKQGGWERKLGFELQGKTAGIIGLGAIGREVAKMCRGLGMQVVANDPYFRDEVFQQTWQIDFCAREDVISHSDFIFVHAPVTEETRHMMNREVFAAMKHGACMINTSRGELVDEEALYEALIQGEIRAAAQDVFSKEPAGQHKLLRLENFILTPHIGAYTKESVENTMKICIQNLRDMLRRD